MVMKSTPRAPLAISGARSSQNVSPTADLIPTGSPVSRRDRLDEIEQRVGVAERPVRRRADAVAIQGMPRMAAISWRDLAPGQHAADAWLGALTELDLDRADLRVRAHSSLSLAMLKRPSGSRQPK